MSAGVRGSHVSHNSKWASVNSKWIIAEKNEENIDLDDVAVWIDATSSNFCRVGISHDQHSVKGEAGNLVTSDLLI